VRILAVISVIDAKQEKTSANILVDARPRAVIFTRDASKAWATAELGGTVMLIDVQRNRVVKRIRLGRADKPVGLVLSPDEKRLYVATGRGNGVAVIDTASLRVVKTIRTGDGPWGLAISED
jgi:YVTN family beta-propeller protein